MGILPWIIIDCTVDVIIRSGDNTRSQVHHYHYANASVIGTPSDAGSSTEMRITADTTSKPSKPKEWTVGDTVTECNWLTLPNDTVIEFVPHSKEATPLDIYAIYHDGSLYDPEFGFRLTDIGGSEKWKVLHFLAPLVSFPEEP